MMVQRRRFFHEFTDEEIMPVAQQIAAVLEEQRRAAIHRLRTCGEILAAAYVAIGQRAPDLVPSLNEDQFVAEVAGALGVPAEEAMAWWRIVTQWPPEELEELCQHPCITSTHLMTIAPVQDAVWRRHKIVQVIHDGLSLASLKKSVKTKLAPREPRRRNRRDDAPLISTTEEGLTKLQTEIECVTNLLDSVLFPGGTNIPDWLANSPPRRNRAAVCAGMRECGEKIGELRQRFDASERALQAAETRLNDSPVANGADGGAPR